jgi:hypothetical protein
MHGLGSEETSLVLHACCRPSEKCVFVNRAFLGLASGDQRVPFCLTQSGVSCKSFWAGMTQRDLSELSILQMYIKQKCPTRMQQYHDQASDLSNTSALARKATSLIPYIW